MFKTPPPAHYSVRKDKGKGNYTPQKQAHLRYVGSTRKNKKTLRLGDLARGQAKILADDAKLVE